MAKYRKNETDLKQTNRHRIYQLVYERRAISKPEIAAQLSISLPTAINNVNQLIEEGLLAEGDMLESTGGRKAVSITCVNDARYAVGIDITLGHISFILVDLYGNIVNSTRLKKQYENTPAYYQELGNTASELVASAGIDRNRILGSGISLPGVLTADAQMLVYSHVLQVSGLACSTIGRGLPEPVILCNDANAAGFAEIWNGNQDDSVYIALNDTVGGAVILNRELYKGHRQRAGEFGHMTLVRDGMPCYCGKRGCVDAYCSARVLAQHVNGDLRQFFQRLHDGDPYLKTVWEQYLSYLATIINNLLTSYDCGVIIGGELGQYFEEYLEELRKLVGELTTFPGNEEYITVCKYKKEASAVGAALLFIKQFINTV